MKAILLTEYGGIDKLKLEERPTPEPQSGELQVRIASASVNPIDWKLRSGSAKDRMPLALPAILGRDAAGTVTKLGLGVTAFRVGDHVLGLVMGAYAEFVTAGESTWTKVPAGLPVKDAGALPLALLTGDQLAVAAIGEKGAGQTVLVTGAAGSVGRAAVWSARTRGAKVIAGVRSKQLEEAKSLGADSVVAVDDDAALEGLPPLDAVADTIGGELIGKLVPRIKPGGTIGSVVGEPAAAKDKGLIIHAFMAHPDGKRLGEIAAAVARGELTIPIAKRFPLAEAAAAQALAERGGIAKVVLEPT